MGQFVVLLSFSSYINDILRVYVCTYKLACTLALSVLGKANFSSTFSCVYKLILVVAGTANFSI